MKKYLISSCLIFAFIFCQNVIAKENLQIVKKGKTEITFDPIEVQSGSIERQTITIKSNISNIFTNVTGFADIAGGYGNYKRQLPITSTSDNPSHYFTIYIGYSKDDKSIVCLQECWNTSSDSYEFPELQFDLEWYLLKNSSF